METIRRFLKAPKTGSFFLFGPRGCGKTSWIHANYKSALKLDLLDPGTFRELSARPEKLREHLTNASKPLVIDEVQKIPELLSVVHAEIERRPDQRFILTGSSSRKLKRDGADLLAGRAALRKIHPFMASELGAEFRLEHALKYGMVPIVVNNATQSPEEVLRSYLALYIREEVQLEGLVRNVPAFNRFVEAASFSQAQTLNVSNVAAECEVERKSVEAFFSILEDLLLAFQLPVFSKRAKRELVKHRKFYFYDCGVFQSIRPKGPLDRVEEIGGAALETLVAQHLRAWIDYRQTGETLYFWRTRSKVEVDFVVYGADTFTAIEVKNSDRIRPEDMRGLRSFNEDYPNAQLILLYRGNELRTREGVSIIPVDQFLSQLHPDQVLFK